VVGIAERILIGARLRRHPAVAIAIGLSLGVFGVLVRVVIDDLVTGPPFLGVFPMALAVTLVLGLPSGLACMLPGWLGVGLFVLPAAFFNLAGIATLVFSFVVSLVVVLMTEGFYRIAKQKMDLAEGRALLLADFQHRVKNHVQLVGSLLAMQARRAAGAEARAALEDAQRRLLAASTLYANAYEPGETIAFADQLARLSRARQNELGGPDRGVALDPATDRAAAWDADRTLPLTLIANELITNAFMHGLASGAGQVDVALAACDGRYRLSVRDSGPGFPFGFDLDRDANFGLTMARKLAEQIGAVLRIDTGRGGSVTVDLPR
jgi:two-component sensor histidine kinase